MGNGFIQVPPDSTGKKLDAEELTVAAQTVHRERVQLSGATDTAIAPVSAANGLLVDLGANNDVTVTGTVGVTGALPSGDNNIGNVDIVSLPTLPAGTNNIGDVDIASALPGGSNKIGVVSQDIVNPTVGSTALAVGFAEIDAASAGDNAVVAAQGAGKSIRVLSVVLVASGGANTCEWRSATTPLSGAMSFAENGGYSLASDYGLFKTADNAALNLNLSAATSVDGHISYVVVDSGI